MCTRKQNQRPIGFALYDKIIKQILYLLVANTEYLFHNLRARKIQQLFFVLFDKALSSANGRPARASGCIAVFCKFAAAAAN